jgi:outer membrane protein OmpA-like peptidoglycan-associated protein
LVGAVMALILLLHPPAPPPAPVALAPPAPPPPPVLVPPAPPPPVQQGMTGELVVVLPDANGRVGTVVVERGGERIVLNEAYATSRITADGVMRLEKLAEPEVHASFDRVVSALPQRPMSFVLYFVRGSDTPTDESRGDLEGMLREVRRRAAPDIVVTGHTDRVGKDESNDQLSLQRAARVKADLVRQGIATDRIRVAGRGEREPVVATDDGIDEPRNRRVEIDVR